MKFETINNTLCRMVEPEPLTTDAKFPCVVRPIQDDSQMGKLNKRKILCGLMNCPNGIFVAKEIRGDDTSLQYTVHAPWGGAVDFEKLEIIGHPVADGSAEWALYQMMHGKWVHNPELEKHKTETTDTRCLHAYAISGDNVIVKNIVTGETSVLGTARPDNVIVYFETTGWQLYEPQPEPKPAYAVGDDVEVNVNGEMKQGKLVRFCSADFMQDNTDAFVLHDFFGRWYGYHRVADIIRKLDPSEVRIKVTLEGTIHRWDSTTFYMFHGNCKYSKIHINALDSETATLVKALLKAQEEK